LETSKRGNGIFVPTTSVGTWAAGGNTTGPRARPPTNARIATTTTTTAKIPLPTPARRAYGGGAAPPPSAMPGEDEPALFERHQVGARPSCRLAFYGARFPGFHASL